MYLKLRAMTDSGRRVAAALILVACVAVVGCGSSDSSSNGGGDVPESVAGLKPAPAVNALPKSGCGSLPPAGKTLDAGGLVADLPDGRAKYYGGYMTPTVKSIYADWASKKKSGYHVGIVWGALVNETQAEQYEGMIKLLKDSSLVSKVTAKNTANNTDVGAELQLFRTMLNSDVDAIIVQPLTGDSFVSLVNEAKKRKIPVITALGAIPSDGALNLDFNSYQAAQEGVARAATIIGGKGNLLYGAGLTVTSIDQDAKRGFDSAIKLCPDIKVAGTIYTGFVSPVAKGETLKFLATHPQDIDLVFTSGPFANGVLEGFDQAGRPIPSVVDTGGTKGVIGYLNDNPDYQAVVQAVTSPGYANAAVSITLRTLTGQGPKVNNMLAPTVDVNRGNLSEWAKPDWSINTQGQPSGPEGAFFPDSYIDGFFNKPSTPK